MSLKVKDKVSLSKDSLYARPSFQQPHTGHMKLGETGVVTKICDEYGHEGGSVVVKFKKGDSWHTNTYREGMLEKIGDKKNTSSTVKKRINKRKKR